MVTKERMIEALEAEYGRERGFIDALPSESLNSHGTEEAWSARDLQAHITAWKQQAVLRLRNDPSAVVEENEGDTDRANAVFFDAYADRSWESVLAESETTHRELIEEIGKLSESDLVRDDQYPWQGGRPLWRVLAGTLLIHPWMHMAEHAVERGGPVEAAGMAEAMVESLSPLNAEPSWIGTLYYNAGCISARAGRPDQALDWLKQGLEIRPELVAWSKQDPDLDSLRADERLEALYASLGEGD